MTPYNVVRLALYTGSGLHSRAFYQKCDYASLTPLRHLCKPDPVQFLSILKTDFHVIKLKDRTQYVMINFI